jgi:hypothetical protein
MSHFSGHFEGASTQFLKQRDINSYYGFYADPKPAFLVNVDPDPGF